MGGEGTKAKKRLVYLDIIRIFACICIVITHYNAYVCGYHTMGGFVLDNGVVPTFYFDVYIGNFASAVFFIISGVSLSVSTKSISTFSELKTFYWKRAKSIYPMFWLIFIASTLFSFWYYRSMTDQGLDKLILSLCGLDGYVMTLTGDWNGFYQVGEWFLGCLILMYLMYPAIWIITKKYPKTFAVAYLVFYVIIVTRINNPFFSIPTLIGYIILGTYLGRYWSPVKYKITILGLVVCAAIMAIPNIDIFSKTAALAIIGYLVVGTFGYTFDLAGKEILSKKIQYLSILTYAMFLIHHKVIFFVIGDMDLQYFPYRYSLCMFCICLFVTLALSVVADKVLRKILSSKIIAELRSCIRLRTDQ